MGPASLPSSGVYAPDFSPYIADCAKTAALIMMNLAFSPVKCDVGPMDDISKKDKDRDKRKDDAQPVAPLAIFSVLGLVVSWCFATFSVCASRLLKSLRLAGLVLLHLPLSYLLCRLSSLR